MLTKEEIKSLFEEKRYSDVLRGVGDTPELADYCGFLYLEAGDYAAAEKFFEKNHGLYQQGFCKLLLGDKISARKVWYSSPENPAIGWGKCLLGILDQKLEAIPSFLQVRNFTEMTLAYLFRAKQIDYAYALIGAKEFLADCNLESYKYIGRVLMSHDHEELAFEYLNKAIDTIPQDYEAYFYLGELFLQQKNLPRAIKAYKRVVELNPYHTPAVNILKKISF